MVYHELTAFAANANDRGEQAPILSDDGRRLAFALAPGTEDPTKPNRIFVMNADGSGQREVDSYPSLCFCGSAIDLSADGRTIVSTDAVQLRIADGTGGGRELIALDSNEINAARISGDGTKVFFRVYRDTSVRGTSPSTPIERGVWVVGADGSGLRQVVGPRQLEALGLPPSDFFSSNGWTLDASTDGARLIFGAFHDPKEAGEGNGLFAVDLDSSGLRELVGRVSYVLNGALSGDGSTVAYSVLDYISGTQEVGVLPFGGGARQKLLEGNWRLPLALPVATGGIPGSDDRLQLSADGRLALLGSSGVLADTRTGALRALGVAGPTLDLGAAPLVDNGLFRATMDATADRVLYLSGDAKGVRQLATVALDPADPGAAPRLTEAGIDPPTVQEKGGSTASVRVRVAATGTLVGVGATTLRDGLADPNIGVVRLTDDGGHGDAVAGDGVFTNNGVGTDCCAAVGPRVVRVMAQGQGADGRRHATAVDLGAFAVVGAAPTATPGG